MIVKFSAALVWLFGWGFVTVLLLEQFEYAEGREAERGPKMASSLALGFIWPVLIAVAVVTSPIWGMVLLTKKIVLDRHQKERNTNS